MTETSEQPAEPQAPPRIKSSANNGYHDPQLSVLRRRGNRKPATVRRLTEWHAMDATERDTAWRQLRAWVTWLHDRYELGVEERLPHCWADHPGLIEELWALKAWREEIYQADQPSGQAARYWHAELRQTMHAALTFYATGCRAGHRGAEGLATADHDLQQRWASADPAAGIPAHMLPTDQSKAPRVDSHLYLTASTMRAHQVDGTATPLSKTVNDFLKHDGSWWTSGEGGWLRITDDGLERTLGKRATALALADSSVDRHNAHKTAQGQAASAGTS